MKTQLTRRTAVTALAAAAVLRHPRAAEPIRLRVSLDSLPSHHRTIAVADYLDKLEAATQGRIKPQLFHSSALFSDLNVPRALFQDQIEMAAPGNWVLTGFEPGFELFQLPSMYAVPIDAVHRITDGRTGAMLSAAVDKKLRLHTLGPWLDLGYTQWYSTGRPLARLSDLKGMKMRNSGGAGQGWRASFFGAIPNTTAWPNVPLALAQGVVDGLQTTHESLASAKLWESGVKYALEDNQSFGAYIPLVTNTFWNGLTPALQQIMTRLWADNIGPYRQSMAAAQVTARQELLKAGVKIASPPADEVAAARKAMLAEQDKLAPQWKISPEVLNQITHDLGA
jgi:C4-dicarboxylate-binding protein DctP